MTTVGWLLLGAAALLVPVPDPATARLHWLVAGRPVSSTPPGRRFRGAWLAALVTRPAVTAACAFGTVGTALRSPVAAVAAGLLGWSAGAAIRVLRRERSAERARAQLAAVVSGLADEYEAGAGVDAALTVVAPQAGRLESTLVRAAAAAGTDAGVGAVLAVEPSLRPLAIGATMAERHGVPLGAVLAGVLADVRDEQEVQRAVQAALVGPRMSMVLLALLPAFGLALGTGMGADPARVLLHTPFGAVALLVGAALDAAGVVWVLRLTVRGQP